MDMPIKPSLHYVYICPWKMFWTSDSYTSSRRFIKLRLVHVAGCEVGWVQSRTKCYMFSHTAASWADADAILSYSILILQIEFEDTRLQLSKHYNIIKLIEVSYLCIMCRKSNGLHESPPTKMSSMGLVKICKLSYIQHTCTCFHLLNRYVDFIQIYTG